MTDARRRRRLVPTAAIALLTLAAASGARASCTANVPGNHIFALAGDDCPFASGTYTPTTPIPIPPSTIVGLFAQNGGSISDLPGATSITVNANPAAGSYAVWSDGVAPSAPFTPSQINLAVPVTIRTFGEDSFGLYASGGGTITTSDGLSVTASGASSIGVYASGASPSGAPSTIAVTRASIVANDPSSNGVQADAGGVVTLTGGSVTLEPIATNGEGLFATDAGSRISATGTSIVTNRLDATGVVSVSGANVVLNGGSVTTNGDGSAGVAAIFGSVSATGTSITTKGGVDLAGVESAGVSIGGPGATGALTSDAIMTAGAGSDGVLVQAEGRATLSGANGVTTTGDNSIGLHALGGGVINALGQTTISTGSTLASTGLNAYGVNANGVGSQVNLAATTITTVGANAHGLYASNGGVIDASGATGVTTSGTGAIGLYASGSGSSITAGAASIATAGASATGLRADADGLVTLNGGSVTTSGSASPAVAASGVGSTVTLNGASSLSTAGNGSIGLYALGGGVINALGQTTIATSGTTSASTGLNAYGVNADGVGSQINLAATTITTTGEGAAGLYASDAMGAGHGGAIAVSGPLGVVTGGSSAYGAWAQGAGSTIALNGPSGFTINGAAFALFADQGGAISTANTLGLVINGGAAGGVEANGSGSSATLKGSTTVALNGNQNTGLLATAGGLISTQGATTIAVSGAQSIGVQALSGAVTAAGALNVATSQATSTAFALSGTSPSIIASGGGTVSAAGNAIAFINAANAVATFDNFNIKNTAGDLILADPSTATVNFNNTVANAGAGNLLNAALGSTIAFNANASTLTGAIQTDPTSVTNVSLTNGTNWTMSASSTATSLNLANSAILFSPSGGFKTLTVGSYVGTGANIALNTALGGPNAGSTDQLVINGGSATGSTALAIKNTSGGAGAATSGNGIPLVVVTNGGTTSPSAFYLANGAPILAGGFEYTLGRNSNQDWYLTSSPAATMSQIQSSVTSVAQAQLNQLITTRVLGSLLLGATEQVNGCSCGGGFASIGSLSLGSHGRWSLNDSVTLLAGAAFESYYQDGANVRAAPIVAASLRYDPPNWGKSRPFFELGAAASPYIDAAYTRYYTNGLTPAQGIGSAVDRSISVFGRVGWVDRLTPVDEAAVFTDLVRGWQQSGGYSEAANALNPFPATVSTGVDRQDVVRFGAQYTHLLFGNIEANISGAIAYGFDNEFGSRVSVVDFGSVAPYPLLNSGWTEFGGRLAYRFSRNLVMDAFMIGTLGGDIGPTLHAGLGVRYAF